MVICPAQLRRQRHDLRARLAWWFRESELALFGVAALPGLLAALYYGLTYRAVLVMVFTFISGAWYTIRIPDTSLREFRDSLAHGEVLLMVDVPQHRVAAVEKCTGQHHHATVAAGSSWTVDRFGIQAAGLTPANEEQLTASWPAQAGRWSA
ncbi:MAG: hypothetical protein PVF75_11015 [Granulosicoccaceae bacterium]